MSAPSRSSQGVTTDVFSTSSSASPISTTGDAPVTVPNVRHTTIDRCNHPVALGDHRLTLRYFASALLFFQWRIGFIRRRLRFGTLGFAQRGFLVSLSFFLLAPSTCRSRSLGSISPVIWLKCHHVPRWLIRTYLKITGCCRSAIKVE